MLRFAAFAVVCVAGEDFFGLGKLSKCVVDLWTSAGKPECLHSLLAFEVGYDVVLGLDGCSYVVMDVRGKAAQMVKDKTVDSIFVSVHDVGLLDKFFEAKVRVLDTVVVVYHGPVEYLGRIFAKLFEIKLVKVFVVTANMEVYTYYPFMGGSCDHLSPVRLVGCSVVRKNSELQRFPNCTVDIFGLYNPPFVELGGFEENAGSEMAVMRMFVKHYSLRPNLTCATCFEKKNGAGLILANYDIVAAGLRSSNPTITDYYLSQIEYALFAPMPTPLPAWRNTIIIFDYETWAYLFASVIALTFTCLLISKEEGLENCFMFIMSILIAAASRIPSRWNYVFLLWTISCLLITNAYRGLLVSFLFKVIRTPRLVTLEDLLKSGMSFGGLQSSVLLSGQPDHIVNAIDPLFQQCSFDMLDCYNQLVDGDFILFQTDVKVMYLRNDNRSHHFYKFHGGGQFYMSFSVRKRHVITDTLQMFLKHAGEAGLIQHLAVYEWRPPPPAPDIEYKDIGLAHMYFIFVAYLIFVILGIITFVLELFIGKEPVYEFAE